MGGTKLGTGVMHEGCAMEEEQGSSFTQAAKTRGCFKGSGELLRELFLSWAGSLNFGQSWTKNITECKIGLLGDQTRSILEDCRLTR